jgi:thermostable 8-oxoguanine DNA glycosylase
MQRAWVMMQSAQVSIELPPADAEVIPGVLWGAVEAFPTPAYWAYQVIARRIASKTVQYKLGVSLREEVGACLLGGHGIPASIGLLAFDHLKRKGAFEALPPSECDLLQWLSEPMQADGRQVRYRFAAQKAHYLSTALRKLSSEEAPSASSRILRDWLTSIPGVGYKTASWIVRNWMDADDVAILDIHILRAGALAGFLDPGLNVVRHYLELENQFLHFSQALGVRASELDSVIWLEMAQSRMTIEHILKDLPEVKLTARRALQRSRSKNREPDTHQLALLR